VKICEFICEDSATARACVALRAQICELDVLISKPATNLGWTTETLLREVLIANLLCKSVYQADCRSDACDAQERTSITPVPVPKRNARFEP